MDDGGAMFDSRVIVEYLDTLTPVGKLLPTVASAPRSSAGKRWPMVLDAAVLVRLEKTLRPTKQQSPEWIKRQWSKVEAS
jgi:glutathione S-transferase